MTKENKNSNLAAFIRSRRQSLGLSFADLAERSGLHVSYWSYLEAGRYQAPAPKHLKMIADALEVSIEDLYGLVGYDIPERLPSFTPYLRAKYELPPEAIADLEKYFAQLRAYYGIPDDQPVFPPKPMTESKPEKNQPNQTNGEARRVA
jgi:transcriptional regulator with XRE-family HTH domain